MDSSSVDVTELSERILQDIEKAVRKLVETSAANGESLVIDDEDGKIRAIPAKELLKSLQQ